MFALESLAQHLCHPCGKHQKHIIFEQNQRWPLPYGNLSLANKVFFHLYPKSKVLVYGSKVIFSAVIVIMHLTSR